MKEFKGTKGEWYTVEEKKGAVFCNTISDRAEEFNTIEDAELCQCWADQYNGKILPESEAIANGKLIASAPDLLEALIRAQPHINGLADLGEVKKLKGLINKAINKALL
jgi:hypothetical protein